MKKKKLFSIKDIATGKKVSLRQMKKNATEEVEANYVLVSDVVKTEMLTKKEIEKLISQKVLKHISFKNKDYIEKKSLKEYFIFKKISNKINNF